MGAALVVDDLLAEDMGRFYDDPLGFVMYAYEWGEGVLEGFDGPDEWQREFLDKWGDEIKKNDFNGHTPVPPVRRAVASGHGIGKSALTAWCVNFIMSTRPLSRGTVTANTSAQLESKTWAEIAKWTKRSITGHWFNVSTGRGSMKMHHIDHKEEWYCHAQTCREENSESFAGQHAVTATSFYIFDEASAVPDKIWEVAEGGLTDGEPMFFVFGNPTRNTGKFRECFKKQRHRWDNKQIDSRSVKITNKRQIQEWIDDWGEDSDFVRVRVKGDFPRAGTKQFIPGDIVEAASGKEVHSSVYQDRVKILGVDIAREGDDQTVFIKRQGTVAYDLEKFRELTAQSVAGRIAETIKSWQPDRVFIDKGNTGSAIYDLLVEWGYRDVVTAVNFGSKADKNEDYANKRVEMWGKCRDWLENGACIPPDSELYDDLVGPEYDFTSREQLILEPKKAMKARGLASPDCGDALALTFAYPVYKESKYVNRGSSYANTDYEMFA